MWYITAIERHITLILTDYVIWMNGWVICFSLKQRQSCVLCFWKPAFWRAVTAPTLNTTPLCLLSEEWPNCSVACVPSLTITHHLSCTDYLKKNISTHAGQFWKSSYSFCLHENNWIEKHCEPNVGQQCPWCSVSPPTLGPLTPFLDLKTCATPTTNLLASAPTDS